MADYTQLLEQIATVEQSEMIRHAHDVLNRLGVTRHDEAIDEALMTEELTTGKDAYHTILTIIEDQLVFQLSEYSIRINDDIAGDVTFFTDLLTAISMLSKHPEPEDILTVLSNQEYDTIETLYPLLNKAYPLDEQRYFEYVTEVSDDLLMRLEEVLKVLPEGVIQADLDRIRRIRTRTESAIAASLQFYDTEASPDDVSVVKEFVNTGRLGFDLIPAFKMLLPDLMDSDQRELPYEIYTLACASKTADPLDASIKIINVIIDDINIPRFVDAVTKINRMINNEN